MRKVSTILASLMAFAFMLAAGNAQAEGKIATIRAADIVQGSPQFKSGQALMKSEFDKRKSDLEAEAKKLGEDLQKFKNDQAVLSSDARAKSEKDLTTRRVDFEYKQRKFGEDFQKRDRELTETMMSKIKDVVFAVAKEKGVDVVIQDPVYATPGVDITADVIKRLQASGGK